MRYARFHPLAASARRAGDAGSGRQRPTASRARRALLGLALVLTAMRCGQAWSAEPNLPKAVPPPPFGFNGLPLPHEQPLPVAAPAPLLRSLDAVAMRPVDINPLEEKKAANVPAPAPAETISGVLEAAWQGGFKLLGAALLALAAVSAASAWYVSRRALDDESDDVMTVEHESVAPESRESASAPREDLRDRLQPLLRASLTVEFEPATLPPVTRIFGRPLASPRYRVDLGHELGDPHFRQPVPVEPAVAAWEETAWAPTRRLDPPYVAAAATAWERPVLRPEGIRK